MPAAPHVPQCQTPDEVSAYLRLLRTWAGDPSFRELTLRVNAIRMARNARQTARQTVNDCLRPGRRRLDRELVIDIAKSLGLDEPGLVRLRRVAEAADGRRSLVTAVDVGDAIPVGGEHFVGRDGEIPAALAALDTATRQGRPPAIVFTGPAGIGKTELAIRTAHELLTANPKPAAFFVDLHGFDADAPPSPPLSVLAVVVKLLGVRDSAILALSTLDHMWRRLAETLAGRWAVLVLDDVPDTASLRELLPPLPNVVVIATSQERLDVAGVVRREVAALDPASSLELLRRFDIAGRVDREPEAADQLVRQVCQGRPFDLVAMGGQLRDPAEAQWTLADHVHRARQLPADEASHPILAGTCHRLDPEARRVFRLLGLYPGHEFSGYDVAVLADVDFETAAAHLGRLHDRHLLLRPHPHRYRLHRVTAAYARRLLDREESPTNRRAALDRLHTATTRHTDSPEPL